MLKDDGGTEPFLLQARMRGDPHAGCACFSMADNFDWVLTLAFVSVRQQARRSAFRAFPSQAAIPLTASSGHSW